MAVFGEYVALFPATLKLVRFAGPVISFYRPASWTGPLYKGIYRGDM